MAAKAHLGISPGTRVIGIAVLIKGELIEWKVKTFKEMWSVEKKEAILSSIEQLCDYYSIQAITIKQVDPAKCSRPLITVIRSIKKLAQKKGIPAISLSLSDLDYDTRSGKKPTKQSISENVVSKHPILKKRYLRERKNRTEYYTKMFEAIAMAELC